MNNMKERLAKVGYITDSRIAKLVGIFENSSKRAERALPVMFLTGAPGSGKTMLAEKFAEVIGATVEFVQCYPGMDSSSFIAEPNISAIIKGDANNAVSDGILVRALKNSCRNLNPTVVIIDELDKADSSIDSFLLDFCNSGRVTNGQQEWKRCDGEIYIFITSNEEREISDALLNRCRHVNIPRPDVDTLMKICGLEKDHYLRRIFLSCPSFSIRQAKSYLQDLEDLGELFDEDVLSQYVDINEIRAFTVEELESMYGYLPEEALEPLENILKIKTDDSDWAQFLSSDKFEEGDCELELDEDGELGIKFNSLSALKDLVEYEVLYKYSTTEYEVKVDDFSILGLDECPHHEVIDGGMIIGIFIMDDRTIIKYHQQITEGGTGPVIASVAPVMIDRYYRD